MGIKFKQWRQPVRRIVTVDEPLLFHMPGHAENPGMTIGCQLHTRYRTQRSSRRQLDDRRRIEIVLGAVGHGGHTVKRAGSMVNGRR